MKFKSILLICLLISCEQTPPKKEVNKKYFHEKPIEHFPWNCSDSEIEYFESLVEFDTLNYESK